MLLFFFQEIWKDTSDIVVYIYLFSALSFVIGSSFAHTFCCHNTLSRDASFIVDYMGLTIFSHGSGIAYVYFAFPMGYQNREGLLNFSFLDTLLICLCLCSMGSMYLSVWTRTMPPSFIRSILRVSAFASPGIAMSIPVLIKMTNLLVVK